MAKFRFKYARRQSSQILFLDEKPKAILDSAKSLP